MKKDIEQIMVDFNNSATESFFSLYHSFEKAAKRIDRMNNDNFFHQLQGQYTMTLRKQLEETAHGLIYKYRPFIKDPEQLHKILSDQITVYIQEFLQKCKSM